MTITTEGVITPETPAETYSHGRMAYDRATSLTVPSSIRHYVAREADALLDALEVFEAIEGRIIDAGSYWPELEHEDEAEYKGLVLAAGEIAERVTYLVEKFPGCAVTAEGEAA